MTSKKINKWLGKNDFKSSVRVYGLKIGVKVRRITLRQMENKWASCSTDGNLSFNSELLGMERKVGEYVIVHELLHFNIPNHGKLFKSLMRVYLGNFEDIEKELRCHD
jgi:predicted metal-dependent hydrolase